MINYYAAKCFLKEKAASVFT